MKFLPETINQPWGYVDLENYCVRNNWNAYRGVMPISIIHRERNIDCSYGGYLEYRKSMLSGTYLDKDEKYLHLGVDFNAPFNTIVSASAVSQIMVVDNDYPEPHGWGPRVILRIAYGFMNYMYFIYSHLDSESVEPLKSRIGDVIPSGYQFAKLGRSPYNGGWWSHIHVQAITHKAWKKYENNLADLDGYGRLEDIEELSSLFPDPLPILIGA